MNNPDFEIFHFSYRPKIKDGFGWYNVNLVFRAYDSMFKTWCLNESKEWREVSVTDNIEIAEKYFDGIRLDFGSKDEEEKLISKIHFHNDSGYKREDVFRVAYEHKINTLLDYKEKFDVFCFRDYIEINPATKGLIAYIEEMKFYPTNSRFKDYSQLFRTLKALDFFWD